MSRSSVRRHFGALIKATEEERERFRSSRLHDSIAMCDLMKCTNNRENVTYRSAGSIGTNTRRESCGGKSERRREGRETTRFALIHATASMGRQRESPLGNTFPRENSLRRGPESSHIAEVPIIASGLLPAAVLLCTSRRERRRARARALYLTVSRASELRERR